MSITEALCWRSADGGRAKPRRPKRVPSQGLVQVPVLVNSIDQETHAAILRAQVMGSAGTHRGTCLDTPCRRAMFSANLRIRPT